MNNPPRICILISNSFAGFHGSSLQAQRQAEHLAKMGQPVTIITHSHKNGGYGLKVVSESKNGVMYHNLSSLWFSGSGAAMFLITLYLIKIRSSFDILQIITSHFCYTGFILAKLFGKKFIIVSTSDRGYLVKPNLWAKLKLVALKSADVIVVKTTKLAKAYQQIFPNKPRVVTIFNGVELSNFKVPTPAEKQEAKLKSGLAADDKLILFVGHLVAEKGLAILVDQALKYTADFSGLGTNKTRSPLNIWCIGNRALAPEFVSALEEKIAKVGLSANLKIMDGNNDIHPYYEAADIFVLPSKREGLPNVVLEAMACGLPCVVSNLGYTADVITPDNGLIFCLEKPDELWDNIKRLLEDGRLRLEMGQQARSKIEREFAIEAVSKQYGSLYAQVIDQT